MAEEGPRPRKGSEGSGEDLPKMSILEHLEELRSRLIHIFAALILGMILCYVISGPLLRWLAAPYPGGLEALYFRKPTEPFFAYLRVSFLAGIFLSSPYLIAQVWLFLSPGLYRHEKRWAVPFVLSMTGAFVGGAAFAYFVAWPVMLEFLVAYGGEMQAAVMVSDYLSLMTHILVGMGLVFEMPVLVWILARIGIVTPAFLWHWFRHALVVIFITAAAITPSGDIPTLLTFAMPMVVLYFLSIGIAWMVGRPRSREA